MLQGLDGVLNGHMIGNSAGRAPRGYLWTRCQDPRGAFDHPRFGDRRFLDVDGKISDSESSAFQTRLVVKVPNRKAQFGCKYDSPTSSSFWGLVRMKGTHSAARSSIYVSQYRLIFRVPLLGKMGNICLHIMAKWSYTNFMTKIEYLAELNMASAKYELRAGNCSGELSRGDGCKKVDRPQPKHIEAQSTLNLIDRELEIIEREPDGDFSKRFTEFFEANKIEPNVRIHWV